jgi:penicillin-binding protein 1C
MNYLHRTQPSRAPQPPVGMVQAAVRFSAKPGTPHIEAAPTEAARTEWFIDGTQQSSFAMHSGAACASKTRSTGDYCSANINQQAARITAPTTGTIIALDPDIPPQQQRVSFTAQGKNLQWLMDGKVFAKGASVQWLPWPGRHVVQIANSQGLVLDEVRLEVRGAGVLAKR